MSDFLGILIGQAVGALFWSLLNAVILIWRALKLRNWPISYRDAYVVSLKACIVALVFVNAALVAVAATGKTDDQLFQNVGLLFGLVAWWFMHSSALLKVAGSSHPLTVKEARAVSASVFAFMFGIFVLVLVAVLLGLLAVK